MFANHRARTAVGIFVALLLVGAGGAEDKPAKGKTDLDSLQGVWVDAKDVWVIRGNVIRAYNSPSSSGSKLEFKIDPSKEPKQIDFDSGRSGMDYGIYEVKGDAFKYCVADRSSRKVNQRPVEFNKVEGVARMYTFQRRAVVTAKASTIRETFLENEALADGTYTERMVIVTGKVHRVQRGETGYIVTLGSSRTVPLLFKFGWDDRPRLAKLKKGDKLQIQGVCFGKSKIKGDSGDEAIVFVGAEIVEAREGEPE